MAAYSKPIFFRTSTMKSEAGVGATAAPWTEAGAWACAVVGRPRRPYSWASVGITTDGGGGVLVTGAAPAVSAAAVVPTRPAAPSAAFLKKSRRPSSIGLLTSSSWRPQSYTDFGGWRRASIRQAARSANASLGGGGGDGPSGDAVGSDPAVRGPGLRDQLGDPHAAGLSRQRLRQGLAGERGAGRAARLQPAAG